MQSPIKSHLSLTLLLPTEAHTHHLGATLAQKVEAGAIIFLKGDLGVGKTTLVRGFLTELGITDKIKSPSYSIVEPYSIHPNLEVFHLDLYRVVDEKELFYIGALEYFSKASIVLVEWPEKGGHFLPPPDIVCSLHLLNEGREAQLDALSALGQRMLISASSFLRGAP